MEGIVRTRCGRAHVPVGVALMFVAALVLSVGAVASSVKAIAPGTLDPAFGVGGIALTSFGTGPTRAVDMFVQADGKYVVLGTYESFDSFPSTKYLTLTRANPDGSLDTSFADGGTTQIAFSGWDRCWLDWRGRNHGTVAVVQRHHRLRPSKLR